ncbi:MAG: T9SS C-terminal target domain-containing protein [Runella slithyformis]|nr:MAG: T9SS C-terminal target domain-containing protein [Runella slithyformis]
MTTNAEDWQNLYERIVGADLRANGKGRVPNFEQFAEKSRLKQSKNNVIPIGILNVDATLMTTQQVEENAKQKENKQKVKADKYEKISIVSASVLQEDIYEANVRFKISQALNLGGAKNDIKRLEIDFQDGKGWRSYPLNDKEIEYRFESVGERVLALRLLTERGPYIFYSKVNVKQLERPKVHREFEVSTEGISQDTINKKTVKGGREAAINVVGGNVRIILSCDQYFDKPIIIGEGFDLGNDNGLDDIAAKYSGTRGALQFLRNRGYDLVLIDYWDARAAIENNAQVLKSVIREVNNTKQGNEKLLVIGESMSGLVARWALREMENAGENHNVKLYISFDSPHQGANIPVSITNLYWEANPSLLTNVIFPLLPQAWRNYYTAIQTPAAAQMLLHYNPRWMSPMGGPHPYFQDFRNRLAALGNNGYPQQCRNVAITNGSSDASDRRLFDNYNYGSNIITSTTPYILQNTYIEAYTNRINENSLNLRLATVGIFITPTLALLNYGSPFNDDFLPGGRSSFVISQRLAPLFSSSGSVKEFRFCFVPTFSAIDFQGDRSNQNSREFLNVFNTNQHPFAAVYGNVLPRNNEFHTFAGNWFRLAQDEGLLSNLIACPGPPQPVTPFVIANQSLDPCFANNQSVTFTAVNTGDINQYLHEWALSPAGISGSGNTFTFNTNQLIPGVQYTLICTRRFANQSYSTGTSSYSITFSVCDPTGGNASPCTFNDGDFVYLLGDGQGTYARYQNGTLYAARTEGDTYIFVSRSTLIANGMPETFANCFAETDPRGGGNSLPFQNGCYTLKSKLSNKMMQMDNDGNGARIRQYNSNGQNNQIFKLESVDGDAYKIMAATSNRSIESPGGNTGYGTELQLWDYNGANHQKWQFVNMNDGSYRLNPKHTNQIVMDVSNANSNDGNLIHLWGIHNGDNQRFVFQSVGCPGTPPPSGCGTGTGLTANYFNGQDLQGSPIATLTQPTIDFAGNEGQTIAGTNVSASNVSARWEGQIEAPVSGSYNFNIRTDDGVRLWLDNQQRVDDYGNYPPTDHNFAVNLTAGQKYNLKIEWKQGNGGYEAKLFWSYPNQGNQIVPACRLYPTGGGGCTPPGAPSISANPSSINSGQSSTLTATNCAGSVAWSNGASGNNISVSPTQTTSYTATCSANGCTSGNSNTATVSVSGGGGGCAAGNFNGHLDNANCGSFSGWVIDFNDYGRTVQVEILVDGQIVATVSANQSRPDLVVAFGTPQAEFHGYTYNVPSNAPWRNGTKSISARPCGGTNQLNDSPQAVNFGACRIGLLEEIDQTGDADVLVVWPNPTTGLLQLKTWLAEAGKVAVVVQDLTGRTAKSNQFRAEAGVFEAQINLEDLPMGVYLLQLQTPQKRFTKKVVLMR